MVDTIDCGLRFDLTCPTCGDRFVFQAPGSVQRREARALVTCAGCKRSEIVVVSLIPVGVMDAKRPSGAQQRKARRERERGAVNA